MKKKFRIPVLLLCLTAMLFGTFAAYAEPESSPAAGGTEAFTEAVPMTSSPAAETAASETVQPETQAPADTQTLADTQEQAAETENAAAAPQEAILVSQGRELLVYNFDSAIMQKPVGLKEADIMINGQKRIGLVPGSYQNAGDPDYVVLYGMYTGTQAIGLFRYDLADQTLQKYYASEPEVQEPAEGQETVYSVNITQQIPQVNVNEEEQPEETQEEKTEDEKKKESEKETVPTLEDDGRYIHLNKESLNRSQVSIYAEKNSKDEWVIKEEKYYSSSFMRILPYIIIGFVEAVVILFAAIFLSSTRK